MKTGKDVVKNIWAVDIELTNDDLREIEKAASQIKIEGAWHPESHEKMRIVNG